MAATWEKYSLVRFTGWGTCNARSKGVRMHDHTDPAKEISSWVYALGRNLDGKKDFVFLDFDIGTPHLSIFLQFGAWSIRSACEDNNASAGDCIKSIVTHEFGHILGLSHEQNRPDDPSSINPVSCRTDDPQTGSNRQLWWGNVMLPANPDEESIMHYCNPNFPGQTTLSYFDKIGLQVHYGEIPALRISNRKITIPRVRIGSKMYKVELNDSNRDGYYSYRLFEKRNYSRSESHDGLPTFDLTNLTLTMPLIKTVSTSPFARRERISKIHWAKMKGFLRSGQWQFRIVDSFLIANVENIN